MHIYTRVYIIRDIICLQILIILKHTFNLIVIYIHNIKYD